MQAIMAKGAIMNVLMGQLLPQLAANDPQFAELFKTKSMNECSNRLIDALANLASEERGGEKSVMADFGAEDLVPIARAFYEKDASAKDMVQMFKEAIVERKKYADPKVEKKAPKAPATPPATPKPATPAPTKSKRATIPTPPPAPTPTEDEEEEWD